MGTNFKPASLEKENVKARGKIFENRFDFAIFFLETIYVHDEIREIDITTLRDDQVGEEQK